jgi:hypothetical protein
MEDRVLGELEMVCHDAMIRSAASQWIELFAFKFKYIQLGSVRVFLELIEH